MNNALICFAAGKSGGHIVPCLTLINNEYANKPILFFSTDAHLDRMILGNHAHITHITLPLEQTSQSRIIKFIGQTVGLIKSFFMSMIHLYKNKPTQVISTGGICAIPVCFAAYILRIPITLYELNAVPGKATTLLASLARNIFVCFPETRLHLAKKQCSVSTYPIRFNTQSELVPIATARDRLTLDQNKKTILVLGGSQGSLFINKIIQQWLISNPHLHGQIQIIHQTGTNHRQAVAHFYENLNLKAIIFDYEHDITPHYIAANLVIGRAGAGTLFETLHFKKPMIIIPLETTATDHQLHNAQAMARAYPTLFSILRQSTLEQSLDPFANELTVQLGLE